MIFGIAVYVGDVYLYSLIRERLSAKFPQAYIERVGQDEQETGFRLIKDIYVLYDNKSFEPPKSSGGYEPVPLYSDDGFGHMIIDMKKICRAISGSSTGQTDDKKESVKDKDRIRLLISYAYIDERENFIRTAISPDSFDSLYPVRIDLMSGIRMPNTFTPESKGSVTKLLRACTDRRFNPSSITEYLNPDSAGFLSCGKPDNEDDVFDIGIKACSTLIKHLRTMCINDDTEALVVVEGWREADLIELIKSCDTLHILLPARMCTEDTGMTKELGIFRKALPSGSLMTVHYCEDYRKQYESINI